MKTIKVLAAVSQEALETKGADVEMEFDTVLLAKQRARYYTSETYRVVSDSSERLMYAQVLVDGVCVFDYFAK